ncbi:MAG: phosphoglycerate kinase [Firmicutes bacterium]|nr:phosphoglycerate kinase [Bacillota bacterium]
MKLSVSDVAVKGKRVLLRVDFNVPLSGERVVDDTRIRAALPTITDLLERGARLILASHLGRPRGEVRPELRLDPVAIRLSELLGQPVRKLDRVIGPEVQQAVKSLADGEAILLENLRFEKGEEANDPDFARQLAQTADLLVNDAFGTAHRAHASTAGVAAYIPAAAGLLMLKEIETLTRCLEDPARPLAAILGGAKVSDKLGVIRRFLKLADTLLLGGAMANTFLAALDYPLGESLYEEELVDDALDILEESETSSCCLQLPVDLVTARELKPRSPFKTVPVGEGDEGWKAVDIGPETAALFGEIAVEAGTILWNGPLGVFETAPFHRGTETVARAVAGSRAFSIAGGGDIVAALESFGLAGQIDFISTGGGATLKFWEGETLPGIAALRDK